MLRGEKENFSWSGGSALKKSVYSLIPHNRFQQSEDGKRSFLPFVTHHIINVSHCPAAQASHGMLLSLQAGVRAGQSEYRGISSLC